MKIKTFFFKILVNGQIYSFQTYEIFSLNHLQTFFDYKKKIVLIEYNGKIIHLNIWPNTKIQNLDTVEIVTVVGGG